MSQDCGEMPPRGSPRIMAGQFPLELVSRVGIVTAPEGNRKAGVGGMFRTTDFQVLATNSASWELKAHVLL